MRHIRSGLASQQLHFNISPHFTSSHDLTTSSGSKGNAADFVEPEGGPGLTWLEISLSRSASDA